jgi:hypothetical protein
VLDAVRASFGRPPKYEKAIASSVAVRHVEPKPRGARRADYTKLILYALATGTKTSAELASACGTGVNDRTFGRARGILVAKGEVLDLGQHGRQRRYQLA